MFGCSDELINSPPQIRGLVITESTYKMEEVLKQCLPTLTYELINPNCIPAVGCADVLAIHDNAAFCAESGKQGFIRVDLKSGKRDSYPTNHDVNGITVSKDRVIYGDETTLSEYNLAARTESVVTQKFRAPVTILPDKTLLAAKSHGNAFAHLTRDASVVLRDYSSHFGGVTQPTSLIGDNTLWFSAFEPFTYLQN